MCTQNMILQAPLPLNTLAITMPRGIKNPRPITAIQPCACSTRASHISWRQDSPDKSCRQTLQTNSTTSCHIHVAPSNMQPCRCLIEKGLATGPQLPRGGNRLTTQLLYGQAFVGCCRRQCQQVLWLSDMMKLVQSTVSKSRSSPTRCDCSLSSQMMSEQPVRSQS